MMHPTKGKLGMQNVPMCMLKSEVVVPYPSLASDDKTQS